MALLANCSWKLDLHVAARPRTIICCRCLRREGIYVEAADHWAGKADDCKDNSHFASRCWLCERCMKTLGLLW